MKARNAILLAAAALLSSCTSVTYRSPSGEIVNIGNVFGEGQVDEVTTTNGFAMRGFRSSHTKVTKVGIDWWGWAKVWNSEAVTDVASGAGDAIKNVSN